MKDQYFGDINDYHKYGLLRAISRATDFNTLVAWILTPNDSRADEKKTEYLSDPDKWSRYDPTLFTQLSKLLNENVERQVSLIETTNILENTNFFSNSSR